LIPALREETEAFFDYVTFTSGTFADLFLNSIGFVNADMAELYELSDLASFGDELMMIQLDPERRPGFLTRLDFLSSHAYFDRTNPSRRGYFIGGVVLGLDPGSHTDLGLEPPPLDGEFSTNREATEALTAPITCTACHEPYVDPPGYALENYDAVGRYQTVDALGGAIDPVADVALDPDLTVRVSTPLELMTALANSRRARSNYVERWASFAYERLPNPQDACVVEELTDDIQNNSHTILNLIADLTQAESFRKRAGD
jgi:hypothetical protein